MMTSISIRSSIELLQMSIVNSLKINLKQKVISEIF